MQLPAEANFGIASARASENFPSTGTLLRDYPELIQSLAMT
jgi:aspartate ammonia-lyase